MYKFSGISAVRTQIAGNPHWLVILALLFLASDALLIGLNIVWRGFDLLDVWPPRPAIVEVGNDYGIPEILNFTKCICVASVLLFLTPASQRRLYIPVALVFLLLFTDDVFRVHENAGVWLGENYLTMFDAGKQANTVGQVVYSVGLAIIVYGTMLFCVMRANGTAHDVIRRLFVLLIWLGFFGVGVDFFNSAILGTLNMGALDAFGSLVENGGEMIIFSLCVWTVAVAINHTSRIPV